MDTPILQAASFDTWDKKYRLKTEQGDILDHTLEDTFARIAQTLCEVEPNNQDYWFDQFLWALQNGAIPAGRIISNAGAEQHKPATSTINCTVSQTIPDSMEGILTSLKEAGLTLKAGCGIGYDFSTLRPKGAFVKGAGAHTSGPLSFMDVFDAMCFTISSAGGRRGAQMATFDITHPDIEDFIKAKREDGRLRQFNLSCLITHDFMHAVRDNLQWTLKFDDVERTLPARQLWQLIMDSTYEYAEPGFILIDRVNEMNNNWFCEEIRATNPCGEQPLPPHGACLLGSVNLTRFVHHPFTPQARFDWKKYQKVVSIFCRMLDNVVEINGLPLYDQRAEILAKRRHGMGFLGLGSVFTMLGLKYGSDKSIDLTERIAKVMAQTGWETGVELAKEKGSAPLLLQDFTITQEMLQARPEMVVDGYELGEEVKGSVLMGHYSRYMQQFPKKLQKQIATHGCRYTHHTSIAPTGTISLSIANNASNGIEPSFGHLYSRNVIREGKKTKEKLDVLSYELLLYREHVDPNATPDTLPDCFVTASDIQPKQHIDIQAAAQKWIDSSISKTANIPTDFPFEDFKDIYFYAWEKGLKGCTTFRFNPEVFQGVLVNENDLANTTYEFQVDDGQVIQVKGNDMIEYDGETHTAANLYDALKEGYYGRF